MRACARGSVRGGGALGAAVLSAARARKAAVLSAARAPKAAVLSAARAPKAAVLSAARAGKVVLQLVRLLCCRLREFVGLLCRRS